MKAPARPRRLCFQVPLRNGQYLAQLVLPSDLSKKEADALCRFLESVAAASIGETGGLKEKDG